MLTKYLLCARNFTYITFDTTYKPAEEGVIDPFTANKEWDSQRYTT